MPRREDERASPMPNPTGVRRAPRTECAAPGQSIEARGGHGRRDDARLGATGRAGRAERRTQDEATRPLGNVGTMTNVESYARALATPRIEFTPKFTDRSSVSCGLAHHSRQFDHSPSRVEWQRSRSAGKVARRRVWRNTRSVAVRGIGDARAGGHGVEPGAVVPKRLPPSPDVPMSRCPDVPSPGSSTQPSAPPSHSSRASC